MGYIGNVVQNVELVPFDGEAIKEDELVRTPVAIEEEGVTVVDERELIKA